MLLLHITDHKKQSAMLLLQGSVSLCLHFVVFNFSPHFLFKRCCALMHSCSPLTQSFIISSYIYSLGESGQTSGSVTIGLPSQTVDRALKCFPEFCHQKEKRGTCRVTDSLTTPQTLTVQPKLFLSLVWPD